MNLSRDSVSCLRGEKSIGIRCIEKGLCRSMGRDKRKRIFYYVMYIYFFLRFPLNFKKVVYFQGFVRICMYLLEISTFIIILYLKLIRKIVRSYIYIYLICTLSSWNCGNNSKDRTTSFYHFRVTSYTRKLN